MGNCFTPCKVKKEVEQFPQQHNLKKVDGVIENKFTEFAKKSESKKDGVRVKIKLSKEQLDWFLLRLENNSGKRLDDVVEKIKAAGDQKASGWEPSLESILECPDA